MSLAMYILIAMAFFYYPDEKTLDSIGNSL